MELKIRTLYKIEPLLSKEILQMIKIISILSDKVKINIKDSDTTDIIKNKIIKAINEQTNHTASFIGNDIIVKDNIIHPISIEVQFQ